MFRSSTILRELVQSLAKVKLLLKHSVILHGCVLCGDVAACREMVCVCCLLCRLMLSLYNIVYFKVNFKLFQV